MRISHFSMRLDHLTELERRSLYRDSKGRLKAYVGFAPMTIVYVSEVKA